ncbi:hypothetical protein RRG08_053677 [Elysia crispata]|uniref:Uncharacterized protein n=1 Tax=Elysia crispata TaxID=231223 RepID=A0AAE1AWX7_9GAST|nr:hypothetical protein RRG08_053677 [Elysia crispata]
MTTPLGITQPVSYYLISYHQYHTIRYDASRTTPLGISPPVSYYLISHYQHHTTRYHNASTCITPLGITPLEPHQWISPAPRQDHYNTITGSRIRDQRHQGQGHTHIASQILARLKK